MEKQKTIKIGTHGENYGSWMSMPVFYMAGGVVAVLVILAIVAFAVLKWNVVGILLVIACLVMIALILWCVWIRRQYAFGAGGMMDKAHQVLLSKIDCECSGTILEVGCGSGPLSIRAAKTWPNAKVLGIDYWGAVWDYSKALCEKNAELEGVGDRCTFERGDATKLALADESVDILISNYVYHNITSVDKHDLLKESLRTLKKGGHFAIQDTMTDKIYGDMEAFAKELRGMGFEKVELIDSQAEIFGSEKMAKMCMLGGSRILTGIK